MSQLRMTTTPLTSSPLARNSLFTLNHTAVNDTDTLSHAQCTWPGEKQLLKKEMKILKKKYKNIKKETKVNRLSLPYSYKLAKADYKQAKKSLKALKTILEKHKKEVVRDKKDYIRNKKNTILNKLRAESQQLYVSNPVRKRMEQLADTELKDENLNWAEENLGITYESQREQAEKLCNMLKETVSRTTIVEAQPQSGKSGFYNKVLDLLCSAGLVKPNHVFQITGLSSTDWKNQSKKRTQEHCGDWNVYHRAELKNAIEPLNNAIKSGNMVIVVVDEAHYGNSSAPSKKRDSNGDLKYQTIHALFEKTRIFEQDTRNVRVLMSSATAECLKMHPITVFKMYPGPGYTSFDNFIEWNLVEHYFNLYNKDSTDPTAGSAYLCRQIVKHYANDPRYHFVRFRSRVAYAAIVERIKLENPNIICENHNSSNRQNLDEKMSQAPENHTIFFLKPGGLLQCSQTLAFKQHHGIIHAFSKDVSVVAQGLLARLLGYNWPRKSYEIDHKQYGPYFVNMKILKQYTTNWNSLTMLSAWDQSKYRRDSNGKVTKRQPMNTDRLSNTGFVSTAPSRNDLDDYDYKIFSSWEEMKVYFWANKSAITPLTKLQGPRKPPPEEFYTCNMRMSGGGRDKRKVMSVEYILENRCTSIARTDQAADKHFFRVWPAYEDVSDKNTLKWILCWRKR